MINGKAAYNVMGDWAVAQFTLKNKTDGKDYTYFPVPGTDGVFDFLADSFTLPKGAKNAAGAADWLALIGSADGQKAFNLAKGSIPARTDVPATDFPTYQQSAMEAFVYGLIGVNVATSLAQTNDRITGRVTNPGGLANYGNLLADERYQHALWNLLVLTVVFMTGTMVFGLLWSVLLERGVSGEGVFRSIYLFPMAISFVAAGVAWRWLLSPAKDDQAIGLNQLFVNLGMPWLQSSWWSDPGRFNMAAMAIPAIWQLSGYIMALFLAGFRGISADQREAARVDGATEWQLYRHVLFPQISPVALSALIILGHMSMKMFDLIYSIAGANSYTAEVPATFMWIQLFPQSNPTGAAANATIILAIVAIVVIPYLIYTNRTEKDGRA